MATGNTKDTTILDDKLNGNSSLTESDDTKPLLLFHLDINQSCFNDRGRDLYGCFGLHVLVKENIFEVIARFISIQPECVMSLDKRRNTPLHYTKSLKIAQLLCQAGADTNAVNMDGETPLHKIAKYDCPSLMNYLVNRGACSNISDISGSTALHKCCIFQQLENVRVLLYHGALTTIVTGRFLKTPLMLAIEQNDQAIMEELWPYLDEWEINRRSWNGYSLLMYLLKTGSMKEWVLKLLEMEPNVNFIGVDGMNALSLSVIMSDAHCFKIIWSRCSRKSILHFDLHTFLGICNFRRSEFLEVLYLVLDSAYGFDLVSNLNEIIRTTDSCLLSLIINAFHNLQYEDCIKVLYTFLSYDVEIKLNDFWTTVNSNVIKPDLKQILLQIVIEFCPNLPLLTIDCIHYSKPSILPVMQHLIGYFDCNLNLALLKALKIIGRSLKMTQRYFWLNDDLKNIKNILQYTRPLYEVREVYKTNIVPFITNNMLYEESLQILEQDAVPSLLELNRDVIRMQIQKACPNNHCDIYYLKHAVDKLKLPQLLIDIIMYRKPIYK